MDRSIIRNAGLSLVLCAGLGMGVVAMANQAYAETTTDKAAATETADKAATTDQKADEKAAAADTKDAKADEKAADTKDAKADEKAADTKDAAAATLKDGEYKASSKGIGGDVPVTVTIKDGKIAKVEVGENSETEGIGSKAIEQLPDAIVKANGTEGVDAVSGATVTSKAIFTAVEDCLKQAAPAADDKAAKDDKAADAKADKAEAGALKDGSYTAEGKGIGGKVPVTVEVKDGKVSEVKVGDNSETQGIGSKAIEQLPDAIVKANGTEGVDAVSGASVTSKAIFDAVNDCMDQAKKAAGTTDKAAADTKDAKAADTKDEKAADTKDAKAADTKDEKASDTKDAAATDKAAETTTEAKAETK